MKGNLRLPAMLFMLALPARRGYGSAVGFLLSVSSIPFVRSTCRPTNPGLVHGNSDLSLDAPRLCLPTETSAKFTLMPEQRSTPGPAQKHLMSWISNFWLEQALQVANNLFRLYPEKYSVGSAGRISLLSAVANQVSVTHEPDVAPPSKETTESVHLKLGSEAMKPKNQNENNQDEQSGVNETVTTVLHTYTDAAGNLSLSGLNVPRRKFEAWVNYTLSSSSADAPSFDESLIQSSEIHVNDEDVRHRLRRLWCDRRLLSDRTEVLAVYKSDTTKSGGVRKAKSTPKRGGFPDLLHIYAERLSAIIEDEIDEEKVAAGELRVFPASDDSEDSIPQDVLDILDGGLLGWLKREYGEQETENLCFNEIVKVSEEEQYKTLQHFLEWFRGRFPYYYDRCDSCGASAKDDQPPPATDVSESAEDDADGTFLGYVYPSREELLGKASRTEIYQCHKCGAFTRFARYNAASSVIKNRRGRCGEYSMLLFRILRATGHESRWVVDWADHVWAEVRLNDHWIHLDPCEAAVDQPLLYQEWGKQQTYIVAFHAPSPIAASITCNMTHHTSRQRRMRPNRSKFPVIEDVTTRYTSDAMDTIHKRRDESAEDLRRSMKKATVDLEHKLNDLLKAK